MSGDIIEEMKIWRALNVWGHARDGGDWEALTNCFCHDATINVSWICSSARDFIARSREIVARRPRGALQKHVFAGPLVRINGARAFSICHVTLENRDELEGHAFDLSAWFRFLDLWRREEDGEWRIYRRTAVYEKDRITPVDPRGVVAGLFGDLDVSAFASATKYLSWWQARQGRVPRRDIISIGSPEEQALKHDAEAWLRGDAV